MPNITVEILRGRTVEQRRAFAEAVTEAAETHLGATPERTRIRFLEVGENEVAIGGAFVQPPDAR
ncbi:tautomerase family protein [Pseudonocardia sp. KRD291]|uniref:tautomerase family protein n=1 Tax=Pseudonocardia sp. KRD291 TaxID=2792007 RepID=UPI001C49DB2C|nr:tautomerase family protein [Pseudonocardia sp. KRD291]MBW0101759.1 tautomerase family protein [Pseudonocardia sp. KRD291]